MTLDWLFARPIAHRGLHDRPSGLIENSFDAARAAVAAGCAIECDVQVSADGEAFVFHDEALDRLTDAAGDIRDRTAGELARLTLKDAKGDAAIPPLAAFLERVGGRVPVVVEIKSRFDGDMRLAEQTARIASGHAGAVALKSFDPAVVSHLRARGVGSVAPLGIVTQARFDHPEWASLSPQARQSMTCLLHWRETQPDFVSYCVDDLPEAAIHLARVALGLPVMTWTVRTPAQWDTARRHADQAIFEGARP